MEEKIVNINDVESIVHNLDNYINSGDDITLNELKCQIENFYNKYDIFYDKHIYNGFDLDLDDNHICIECRLYNIETNKILAIYKHDANNFLHNCQYDDELTMHETYELFAIYLHNCKNISSNIEEIIDDIKTTINNYNDKDKDKDKELYTTEELYKKFNNYNDFCISNNIHIKYYICKEKLGEYIFKGSTDYDEYFFETTKLLQYCDAFNKTNKMLLAKLEIIAMILDLILHNKFIGGYETNG